MASNHYFIGSDGVTQLFLVNANAGLPTPGGDPSSAATTPFGIRSEWVLTAAKRLDSYVDETIPLFYWGSTVDGAQAHLDLLGTIFDDPLTGLAAFVYQPNGASSAASYGVYWAEVVQEKPADGTRKSPGEGALIYYIDFTFRRTPTPGTTIFEQLLG